MPDRPKVRICEVGPRDGLQNEQQFVSTDDKVQLINLLSATGLDYIEVASFVSPKWVPQMADGKDVLARISRRSDIVYAALTPNLRGYEEAVKASANEVAIFASASETFSQKNINCSIAESLVRYETICEQSGKDGVSVRGYVSCVVACPYEGVVSPDAVCKVAAQLMGMGCREVSLGDTIGVANPDQVTALLDVVLQVVPVEKIAGHFHDTSGRALACIHSALGLGVRVFDSSVGGAGGCPFAPGAKGNVATEHVVQSLEAEGYNTGINLVALQRASAFITKLLEKRP